MFQQSTKEQLYINGDDVEETGKSNIEAERDVFTALDVLIKKNER